MSRSVITTCLVLVLIGGAVVVYFTLAAQPQTFCLQLSLYITSSVILTAIPLLICYAQTTSIARQLAKLETLQNRSVSSTAHFKAAINTLQSVNPATLDRYYAWPMLTFASVVLYYWLITIAAYLRPDYFSTANVILGGMVVLQSNTDPLHILHYQQGTFVAMCFGFVGAYIYIVWRLLDRINNNDIYPISFYYYVARIFAASLIAGVIRHVTPIAAGDVPVLLLSFIAGFVPHVFVIALVRRVSKAIRILSDQPDPKNDLMPSNFSLSMIQGLDRDKIDRLAELNVTNAEVLACQNPFILWLRLPYELLLVMDWISQAMLYRTVKEHNLMSMRSVCINGMLDFIRIGSDAHGVDLIAEKIGLKPEAVSVLIRSIARDPSFQRLMEVDLALGTAEHSPNPV